MQNELFRIGSLRCVKYIEKKTKQYQHLAPFCVDKVQSQNLKRDNKKMSAWGNLKSSFHRYSPWSLSVFLVKKDWKTKYGFGDSISNVGLS